MWLRGCIIAEVVVVKAPLLYYYGHGGRLLAEIRSIPSTIIIVKHYNNVFLSPLPPQLSTNHHKICNNQWRPVAKIVCIVRSATYGWTRGTIGSDNKLCKKRVNNKTLRWLGYTEVQCHGERVLHGAGVRQTDRRTDSGCLKEEGLRKSRGQIAFSSNTGFTFLPNIPSFANYEDGRRGALGSLRIVMWTIRLLFILFLLLLIHLRKIKSNTIWPWTHN